MNIDFRDYLNELEVKVTLFHCYLNYLFITFLQCVLEVNNSSSF